MTGVVQGPAPALQSYLRMDAMIDAALKTGAQAVRSIQCMLGGVLEQQ